MSTGAVVRGEGGAALSAAPPLVVAGFVPPGDGADGSSLSLQSVLGDEGATALRALFDALDVEPLGVLAKGGSTAVVVKVQDAAGRPRVVKFARHRDGLVDGHDLTTFRAKADQIRKVRTEAPGLGRHYVEIVDHFDGPDWSAVVMPFYAGTDLAAGLREDANIAGFHAMTNRVLGSLAANGYATSTIAVADGAEEVRATHLRRVSRRSTFFDAQLPDGLTGRAIVVNGLECRPLTELLARIDAEPSWLRVLAPDRLHFPVHGDLNTRNVLMNGDDFVLVDPRGTTEHWDLVYDLSKLLYSLTTWDLSLRSGFAIDRDRGAHLDGRGGVWRVRTRDHVDAYARAALELCASVADHPALGDLVAARETAATRLLFAHAVDMVAEAACRLSDTRARSHEGAEVSPSELALGNYLCGRLLLEDLVRSFERHEQPDAAVHLALLDGPC